MRTSHSRVLDNVLSLPGEADGLHKSFFFYANMNKHILVLCFQRVLQPTEFLRKKSITKKPRYTHWLCPHAQLVISL